MGGRVEEGLGGHGEDKECKTLEVHSQLREDHNRVNASMTRLSEVRERLLEDLNRVDASMRRLWKKAGVHEHEDVGDGNWETGGGGSTSSTELPCHTEWEWKTDAPEFIPGSMTGAGKDALQHAQQQQQQQQQPPLAVAKGTVQAVVANASPSARQTIPQLPQLKQTSQLPMGSDKAVAACALGVPVSSSGEFSGSAILSQIRGQYETHLRERNNQLEVIKQYTRQVKIETAQRRASWEKEKQGHLQQLGQYRVLMNQYCGPREDANCSGSGHNMRATVKQSPFFTPSGPLQWTHESSGREQESVVDCHGTRDCEVLCLAGSLPEHPGPDWCGAHEDLLRDGSDQQDTGSSEVCLAGSVADSLRDGEQASARLDCRDIGNQDVYSTSFVASTLRAMFPHATIRTFCEDSDNGAVTDRGEGAVAVSKAHMQQLNQDGDAKDALEGSHGGSSKAKDDTVDTVEANSHHSCSSSTLQSVAMADEPLACAVSVDEPLARTVSVGEYLGRTTSALSVQSKGLSWADMGDEEDLTDED